MNNSNTIVSPKLIYISIFIVILIGAFLESGVVFLCYYPVPLFELLWLGILISYVLGLPACFICIAFKYFIYFSIKTRKILWKNLISILPFLLSIIIIYFLCNNVRDTFRSIRDSRFNAQFSEYQDVVDKYIIETANVDQYDQWVTTPKGLKAGIRVLKYRNNSNDDKKILEVRFSTFGSMPPLRGGYLYISNEDVITNNKIYRNSSLVFRKIKPHWYAYSE